MRSRLSEVGIDTMIYYPRPLHRLPPFSGSGYFLPESERAAEEVLSLPIWPELDGDTQGRVADALKAAMQWQSRDQTG